MNEEKQDFSNLGFVKTFVLPGLLIFLVPVVSYFFFRHAEHSFDKEARESVLAQIQADQSMSQEEREKAIELFTKVPFSQLIKNQEFAADLDPILRFNYGTFRWAILLSAISVITSVAMFVLTGICVWLSLRSQRTQYLSLSIGWQVLRIYGAFQTLVQGLLLVALSFWVTALWFNIYILKLIFVVGLVAIIACCLVLAAIFKKPESKFEIAGKVIGKGEAPRLWEELGMICEKVGTEPPDQVIVGIDDNFFVTEMPVTVDGKTYKGRTLFVSLALLKQLNGTEADAVLAHEMAHFSGQDTLYSKKISPLLVRYGNYLQALYEGGVTLPIFYFMNCFRAFYELSLGKLSREREFRADRIATETTSPTDLAGSLLRIAAYSYYRNDVQNELFKQEEAMESANVSERIEQGFPAYAVSFAAKPDIGELETSHPFDSHPPLAQRLEAVSIPIQSQDTQTLLTHVGDGSWYQKIDGAEEIESQQWEEFEEQFRQFHAETLPYRFLPETDEEREIVTKAFPEISIEGKEGVLVLDYEKMTFATWPEPIHYHEISQCTMHDDGKLQFDYGRGGKQYLKTKKFGTQQQKLVDAINHYYTRYLTAVEYQKQKNEGDSQ